MASLTIVIIMTLEMSFTTIKFFITQATDVRCFINIGSLAVGLNAADLKLQGGWLFIRRHDTQQNDIQHNDIQHNDIQHNDIQYNDIQQNDIQDNDIQQNDIHQNDTHQNDIQQNDIRHNLRRSSNMTLVIHDTCHT